MTESSAAQSVVELADGRSLGVAQWGPADGEPIVYCHGFPGNRLEPQLAQTVVERRGLPVRTIAFDRPGYGRSSPAPGRRFLDWPADMSEAADRMGIGEFSVLGASGGCPFALACGLLLPDRVSRIGIVAGVGPLDAPGMGDTPSIAGPSRLRPIRQLQWHLVARAAKTGRIDRAIDRAIATMTGVDRQAMEMPEVRSWYRAVFAEAFVQGGAAAALEGELYRRPWGFEPGDVELNTFLWHGGQDTWAPPATAKWFADRLPRAQLVTWPEHGHFSWAASPQACSELLATMAGRAPRTCGSPGATQTRTDEGGRSQPPGGDQP